MLIYILLWGYLSYVVICSIAIFYLKLDGACPDFQTLSYIYSMTDMNWFGCFLIYLVQIFVFPIWWLCHIVYAFMYWICHVGREEN
jgi:hypothetical protein